MSEVWRARHVGDDAPRFAIKFLRKDSMADNDLRTRFVRECEVHVAKLDHENIVPAIDSFNDPPGLVMKYVEGRNLAEVMASERASLTVERILEISRGVLSALQAAHDAGVYHRDVKPQNILIEQGTGRPILIDFGIALVEGKERLTLGVQYLTLQYVSPEQLSHGLIDGRADIYSFGCVLYEMISGATPFQREPDPSRAHLELVPKTPTKLNPLAPKGLDRVVMTCLAKDPEARYSSCAEVMEALLQAVGKTQPHTAATGPAETQPRPLPPTIPIPTQPPYTPPQPTWPLTERMPQTERPQYTERKQDASAAATGGTRPNRSWQFLLGFADSALVAALAAALWLYLTPVTTRVYGSSSVGDDLAPAVSLAFLESKGLSHVTCVDVVRPYSYKDKDGKMQEKPTEKMKECAGDFSLFHRRRMIQIYPPSTGVAFECLAAKTCDIGMASRRVKLDEGKTYPGLEDLSSRSSEHVIGLDGIAIVVPESAPGFSMTIGPGAS